MEQEALQEAAFQFAVRTVKLHKHLKETQEESFLTLQLMTEAAQLGVQTERVAAQKAGKAFLQSLNKADEHIRAVHYWIRLLRETNYLDNQQAQSLYNDIAAMQQQVGSLLKVLSTG